MAKQGDGARLLLLEPFGGMAGDMFLAALLDLGDPRFELAHLVDLAEALVPGEARLATAVAWRGSLSGRTLSVTTPESGSAPHRGLAQCLERIAAAPLSTAAQRRAGAIFRRIAAAEAAIHGCDIEEVHFHEVGAVDALVDVCGAALALERLEIEHVHCTPPYAGGGA